MAEANQGFVDRVRNLFKGKAEPAVKQTTEYRPAPDTFHGWMRAFRKWYYDSLTKTQTRLDLYDKYHFLDQNLSEASAALNIYADNIVSGAIGGEENYMVRIDSNAVGADKIEEVVSDTEQRTRVKDAIWEISRDLTKNGDNWQEVVVASNGKKEFYIDKLKKLPEKTMWADVDERGVFKDLEKPYIQRINPHDEGIPFDSWRTIHFKIGQGVYGVGNSLFANASQRIGRQLLWIDDAMVLARISRAWMRYAYKVDVSGLSTDEIWEYLDNFMERIKRKEVVDKDSGQLSLLDTPWMPDEDIAIPIAEGSKQDIQVLAGDMNIGNIDDLHYLQNKFLMAVSIPKAYVGKEEGTRSKATLEQIDVQFARQVRRRQRALIPGLREFYSLAFILAGIYPDSFKWEIVFPEMATSDEMMKWEMYKIKAETAKIMVVDVGAVNTRWVLEELMGFNEDEIKKWGAIVATPGEEPRPGGTGQVQLPPGTAEQVRKNPYIRALLEDFMDIVAWNNERDRAAELRPVGLEK